MARLSTSKLKLEPRGWDLSCKARIGALGLNVRSEAGI